MTSAGSRIVLPVTLLLLLLAGSATGAEVKKHYEESVVAEGEKGVFTVEMIPPREGLMMGVNSIELILHDAGGSDVPGAEIAVTPWMPEHNHGVSEKPVVTDRGGGAYTVENILFTMTGWWELTVEVSKGDLSDSAIFNFPEVKASGHGHTAPMKAKSDLDRATIVKSEKGLFTVGYESGTTPIPLNRIHHWTLSVKDKEGTPVTGAAVKVVGDMPEHGHGLPTEPELTEEIEGGRYVIDGIRFSMPGWWVITFHVTAGELMDNASFNLLLQ